MRVCKAKAMTPDEELDYLNNEIDKAGNYFAWEVHPNKIRASDMLIKRLRQKIKKIVASPEFLEYNPLYRLL